MTKNIGICWAPSSVSGWGIYGLNLARELLNDGRFLPCLLVEPARLHLDPLLAARLGPILQEGREYRGQSRVPFPLFHAMGNDFHGMEQIKGEANVGFFFIEDTRFSSSGLERARQMEVLVAGSTWNGHLVSRLNVRPTIVSLQGVDPSLFHPAPVARLFPERFVIFSGGKLEYRKGQDLVIAAFKAFHQRHKDALLVLAWHNMWPQTAQEIGAAGLVTGLPTMDASRRWNFQSWLPQNGLEADSFIDIGFVPNTTMPYVLRQADVGVYANRCEGGTNLVAMETMACGVPCILSKNTGHLDIIADDCLVLERQGPCRPTPWFPGVEGWGESSVDEIISHLEWAYAHRTELSAMGARVAERMRGFSWAIQVRRLMEQLGF